MKIKKGTTVRLQTTNGGDTIVRLLEDYVPTYCAVVQGTAGWFTVGADRIKSIRQAINVNTLQVVIGRMESSRLRSLRRRLEAKLLEEAKAGKPGTREMFRRIDIITAAGTELSQRGELNPSAISYVDVDQEVVLGDPATLIRSQRSYRVF